ncbi:MAG: sugar phosphate isomerase/epimerase [Planctomycetes bacterium]|nr:sugar phosphate isomerase/epimerase [Planctomycetota bacterium]
MKSTYEFCTTFRAHDIPVCFATAAGLNPFELVKNPEPLRVLADNGIKQVRIGYFHYDRNRDFRSYIEDMKRCINELAAISRRIGIQCVSQLHHGTALTSPSMAWYICKDSDPVGHGIMLDPANQCFEGSDNFELSLLLLGPYLAAVGVKNVAPILELKKRCRRERVELKDGEVYYPDILRSCVHAKFTGLLIHQTHDQLDDSEKILIRLKSDVACLNDLLGKATGNIEGVHESFCINR